MRKNLMNLLLRKIPQKHKKEEHTKVYTLSYELLIIYSLQNITCSIYVSFV